MHTEDPEVKRTLVQYWAQRPVAVSGTAGAS
jgi:hypothetical protein